MSWSPLEKPPMKFTPYWLDTSRQEPNGSTNEMGRSLGESRSLWS
jgi:hypothetical protein